MPGAKRTILHSRGALKDAFTVKLYGRGVVLTGNPASANPNPPTVKRGAIRTFSKASRRRMREFLVAHEPEPGWGVYDVTLTIPGDPLPISEANSLFASFSLGAAKRGEGFVWRKEVQTCGQLHWHLLYTVRPMSSGAESLDLGALHIKTRWYETIRDLGPCTWTSKRGVVMQCSSRWAIPQAERRAVVVKSEEVGKSAGWYRYMCDHCTKTKDHQVANDSGRHWGVVGREHFARTLPDSVQLSAEEYAVLLRWMRRLARPSFPCARAPFGRKLGRKLLRGSRGRSVWFTSPRTVERAVGLAMSVVAERGVS